MAYTLVDGAVMRHKWMAPWTISCPWKVPAGYQNPDGEAWKRGCLVDDWKNTQDRVVYGCTDITPVVISGDGSLRMLVVTRSDLDAPILGFKWFVGGRIMLPAWNTVGENQNQQSALLKLEDELRIRPDSVRALYELGIGETYFDKTLHYRTQAGGTPVVHNLERRICTINFNYVAVLESALVAETLTAASVTDPEWIHQDELPSRRSELCAYVFTLLTHLVESWREHPL